MWLLLRGLLRLRPLLAQKMQDTDGKAGVLAVFDELAQVGQPGLLGFGVVGDDRYDGVRDRSLVLEAALVSQQGRQEVHEDAVLARKLRPERPDRSDYNDLFMKKKITLGVANSHLINRRIRSFQKHRSQ